MRTDADERDELPGVVARIRKAREDAQAALAIVDELFPEAEELRKPPMGSEQRQYQMPEEESA